MSIHVQKAQAPHETIFVVFMCRNGAVVKVVLKKIQPRENVAGSTLMGEAD